MQLANASKKTYPRLLYYAMVLRSPFPQNSTVPTAEYIASRHTVDSTGMMIRKLKEREKEVFNKEVHPLHACYGCFEFENYNCLLEGIQ